MPNRETIAVYILLGKTFIKCDPYDARGVLVLLYSIENAFSLSAWKALNTAVQFNALAALSKDGSSRREARWSLTRVILHLERLLAQPERGGTP